MSQPDQSREEGRNAGRAEVLGELKTNIEAADGDYELAVKATLRGQGAGAVKLAVETRRRDTN